MEGKAIFDIRVVGGSTCKCGTPETARLICLEKDGVRKYFCLCSKCNRRTNAYVEMTNATGAWKEGFTFTQQLNEDRGEE